MNWKKPKQTRRNQNQQTFVPETVGAHQNFGTLNVTNDGICCSAASSYFSNINQISKRITARFYRILGNRELVMTFACTTFPPNQLWFLNRFHSGFLELWCYPVNQLEPASSRMRRQRGTLHNRSKWQQQGCLLPTNYRLSFCFAATKCILRQNMIK